MHFATTLWCTAITDISWRGPESIRGLPPNDLNTVLLSTSLFLTQSILAEQKGHVEAVEGDEDEDEALPVAASPRNDEAKDVSGQTVMFERSLSLASVAVSEGGYYPLL